MESENQQAARTLVPFKEYNIMNVRLQTDSFRFCLNDDTGLTEYPLLNLNVNRVELSMQQENGADDPANFILKKMGISDIPYMTVDAGLHLESFYYNMEAGSYEPLIEPWLVNASVMQQTAATRLMVEVKSHEMLNLNLTYGMAKVLRKIQDRVDLDVNEWEDEVKLSKTKTMERQRTRESNSGAAKVRRHESAIDEEAPGFHFQNDLGISTKLTLEGFERRM